MARTKTTTPATPKTSTPKTSSKSTPAPAPVPEPVSASTVVVDIPVETEAPVSAVFDQFSSFMSKLQSVSTQLSALRTEFRAIERNVSRDIKSAAKMSQKRKRKTGDRAPSGFVKPALISNELAAFLGAPEGSEMARTEVTKKINQYVKAQNLQNAKNGRIIHPDKKLATLLKTKKDEELTYFNLQKYMSCHFAKASDKVATVSSA